MRPDRAIRYWDGDPLELLPGVTLVRCGGHFPGSAVLHWTGGVEGRGARLVGTQHPGRGEVGRTSFIRQVHPVYPGRIALAPGSESS